MDEIGSATRPLLSTATIASWLESLQTEAAKAGVKLAELRESQSHTPTVAADYDADRAIGRISVWATGEFDFEVLHTSNGEFAFFRHQSTVDLADVALLEAYRAFLKSMADPGARSD
ncbi:immunity protein TriTu family protein [Granulicella tundricola]|uniref:immunity protein TriTu family protein n=1 Tax=Granulicella tundricola TaxID=940615 RepID=UPI0005A129E2|nr:hypothetical protein [Granulicella tundricola]